MFRGGKLDELTPDAATIENYLEDIPSGKCTPPSVIWSLMMAPAHQEPVACNTMAWRKAVIIPLTVRPLQSSSLVGMKPAGWMVLWVSWSAVPKA